MDAPIAPAALRRPDDGPAYDLISLGLVLFTILLIAVWTTHFFRQQPADVSDFNRVVAHAEFDPATADLTSAGHLSVAKWADFNLPTPNGHHITKEFRKHLRLALDREAEERAGLKALMAQPHGDGFDRVAAQNRLRQEEGAARQYARAWYNRQAEWLDACDTANFDSVAHYELAEFLKSLDMVKEEALEKEKILNAHPELRGDPPLDDRGLPVIREFHHGGAK